MQKVNAMDLVSPEELHQYVQSQLDQYGDTPEKLMNLLVKVATFKAILEDALELETPISAVLEKEEVVV